MSPTSGVISEAWTLYRAHWRHLITISFAVYLAAAFIGGLVAIVFETWIAAALGGLVSFVALFWLQAALVKAVDDLRDGRVDLSLSETFAAVRVHLATVTLAGLLFGLVFGLGLCVLLLVAVILGTVGALIGLVGIIAWFLLLVVWWSVVIPAIVMENKGVGAGLSRSRQLVEGYGWPVLGKIALVFLLLVGFTLVLALLLSPLDDEIQNIVSQVVSGALTAPFVALVLTLLYFRLRAAKETPAAPPPPPAPA
jgi:hypothetical protein